MLLRLQNVCYSRTIACFGFSQSDPRSRMVTVFGTTLQTCRRAKALPKRKITDSVFKMNYSFLTCHTQEMHKVQEHPCWAQRKKRLSRHTWQYFRKNIRREMDTAETSRCIIAKQIYSSKSVIHNTQDMLKQATCFG
jgi:ribosome-binding protein aMBF1 (putative translation factor)